jgi:hypothetical protein
VVTVARTARGSPCSAAKPTPLSCTRTIHSYLALPKRCKSVATPPVSET